MSKTKIAKKLKKISSSLRMRCYTSFWRKEREKTSRKRKQNPSERRMQRRGEKEALKEMDMRLGTHCRREKGKLKETVIVNLRNNPK